MAEEDVRLVIFQVLEGLRHMHCEGFAHRDVKPGVGDPSLSRISLQTD
jgi:serine/threonine protein kinase